MISPMVSTIVALAALTSYAGPAPRTAPLASTRASRAVQGEMAQSTGGPAAGGAGPQPAQAPGPQTGPQTGVQSGVTVTPDTVTVGDPFVVRVRVRAPRGASIQFPVGPDSGAAVEALDPRVVVAADTVTATDQTAVYRLVAWDVGALPLGLADVIVRTSDGERRVALAAASVTVRSVLPADSASRVPKPARDLIPQGGPWWLKWLWLALLALALLALLIWWLVRRRRRLAAGQPPLAPYEVAEREFARVEALKLLELGERGRFVALMVEVLRDYLAAEITAARPSLTSTELLDAVRGRPEVPADRLAAVLGEADLVKFARRPVTAERGRELGREARAVVRDVHAALTPPEPAPEQSAPAEAAA